MSDNPKAAGVERFQFVGGTAEDRQSPVDYSAVTCGDCRHMHPAPAVAQQVHGCSHECRASRQMMFMGYQQETMPSDILRVNSAPQVQMRPIVFSRFAGTTPAGDACSHFEEKRQ